ncbi:putative ribonuclease H protein, partial [Trifolium medium]|nr:putative ribonuclease H protein [Trifolium medium]
MWSWKLVWTEALDVTESEAALELQQLLEQVRPIRGNSDRRKCSSNSDGFFTVRAAYLALQSRLEGAVIDTQTVAALKRLWKNNVPSKVIVFGWRLLLEKLPTREALYRK